MSMSQRNGLAWPIRRTTSAKGGTILQIRITSQFQLDRRHDQFIFLETRPHADKVSRERNECSDVRSGRRDCRERNLEWVSVWSSRRVHGLQSASRSSVRSIISRIVCTFKIDLAWIDLALSVLHERIGKNGQVSNLRLGAAVLDRIHHGSERVIVRAAVDIDSKQNAKAHSSLQRHNYLLKSGRIMGLDYLLFACNDHRQHGRIACFFLPCASLISPLAMQIAATVVSKHEHFRSDCFLHLVTYSGNVM